MSEIAIALVYPELLGTYGDGGNAEVLAARARWRGIDATVINVPAGDALPTSCDLYVLGGGEDEPQTLAAQSLRDGSPLTRAVEGGAVVLAVCAGLQIVGESFVGSDGEVEDGLGLLPLRTRRSLAPPTEPVPPRAVGDLAVRATGALAHLPVLTGYENHGGRSVRVDTVDDAGGPLGTVVGGVGMAVGNGTPDAAEGWVRDLGRGHVVATYLHGPVLAQNPALADHLLAAATGAPLPDLGRPDPAAPLRAARLRQLGLPPD
ncbi:MAG TPA: glutamine amidotransferase [Mycobacteriales bacterium]|nr:glutamine amidotransferase [Mycobacteriales bacterium]